jgi:hypothetical protein
MLILRGFAEPTRVSLHLTKWQWIAGVSWPARRNEPVQVLLARAIVTALDRFGVAAFLAVFCRCLRILGRVCSGSVILAPIGLIRDVCSDGQDLT